MPPLTENLRPGVTVVIAASEDWPAHRLRVTDVFLDCVGGIALDGPFAGEYGEPEFHQIQAIEPKGQRQGS